MSAGTLDKSGGSEDQYKQALNRALGILSRRQHSVYELKTKLARKFEKQIVERVIGRLAELGYLDEAAFAREYAGQRFRRSPRAQLAVVCELLKRGIERAVAEKAVWAVMEEEGLSEDMLAENAARKKYLTLAEFEKTEQQKKIFRFLTSRGFTNAVAFRAMKNVFPG